MSATIVEAVVKLATKVKGEAVKPANATIAAALDTLADALAGENVQVPMTQQGAILALAQYVDGMVKPEGTITIDENGEGIDVAQYATADVSVSGGGVDVGAPTHVVRNNSAPEVGDYLPANSVIGGLTIGGSVIVANDQFNSMADVAAGVTATTKPDTELAPTSCDAYVVTVDDDEITTFEAWDGTLTPGTVTVQAGPQVSTCNVWSFTVPALEYDFDTWTGQALYLYMH